MGKPKFIFFATLFGLLSLLSASAFIVGLINDSSVTDNIARRIGDLTLTIAFGVLLFAFIKGPLKTNLGLTGFLFVIIVVGVGFLTSLIDLLISLFTGSPNGIGVLGLALFGVALFFFIRGSNTARLGLAWIFVSSVLGLLLYAAYEYIVFDYFNVPSPYEYHSDRIDISIERVFEGPLGKIQLLQWILALVLCAYFLFSQDLKNELSKRRLNDQPNEFYKTLEQKLADPRKQKLGPALLAALKKSFVRRDA